MHRHSGPMFFKAFPYVFILYTVYSPNFTYLVARYKYSHLLIGSAPYFGSTFIAEPPKNHAHSKCISILAPCFSRVSLMYIYFTQCPPPFVHISSPVINVPTSSSVPPRILIPLSWRNHLKKMHFQRKRSASLKIRHSADASSLKHATWWNIHLRSHVYKGFPFISLSTHPIFPYLTFWVACCKVFRLGLCAALCGCNLVEDPPQTPCL